MATISNFLNKILVPLLLAGFSILITGQRMS